jgi:serine protease Do
MRIALGLILSFTLVGQCVAESLNFEVPPPAIVTALDPGAPALPVSFARMAASLVDGQAVADLRTGYVGCKTSGEILHWKSELNRFSDPDFERLFREEFKKSGFNVSGDQTNLFEQDRKGADLQIGALVTDLKVRVCATTISAHIDGAAIMGIEWQVYSASAGKVVARIPTVGGVSSVKTTAWSGTFAKLMQATFAENVRQLEANPQFRQIVLNPIPASTNAAALVPLKIAVGRAALSIPLKEAANGAVVIFAGSGSGSGVLISADGYILTNHHVAGESGRVRIRWADGTDTVGEVVRADRRRDVALIKVAAPNGRPLTIRHTPVELGETVFAIGTPLDDALQNTVTRGIVSGLRMMDGESFIQSDTPITHGNSGGPLLDDKGAIVGLSDLGADPSLGSTINFFIPIGDALKVLALRPAS